MGKKKRQLLPENVRDTHVFEKPPQRAARSGSTEGALWVNPSTCLTVPDAPENLPKREATCACVSE